MPETEMDRPYDDVWATLKAAPKVAIVEAAAPLNGKPLYAIYTYRSGQAVGQSIARGDELDSWREDLAATGWDVRLGWELRGQPAPEAFGGAQ